MRTIELLPLANRTASGYTDPITLDINDKLDDVIFELAVPTVVRTDQTLAVRLQQLLGENWVDVVCQTTVTTALTSPHRTVLTFGDNTTAVKEGVGDATAASGALGLPLFSNIVRVKWTFAGSAAVAGVAAKGTITVSDTPVANETMEIGDTTYTFVAERSAAGEITIDADNAEQVLNIVAAVNEDSANTTAADGAGNTVVITAVTPGTAGNLLTFTETATGIAVDGEGVLGTTTAGVDATYHKFGASAFLKNK